MDKKLSYDADEDVLYFNKGKMVQDSLDIGNLYVEFSSDSRIVGLEILEASRTISNMTGEDFSREDLSKIQDADISVHREGDFAFVTLKFTFRRDGETVDESISVNMPSGAATA